MDRPSGSSWIATLLGPRADVEREVGCCLSFFTGVGKGRDVRRSRTHLGIGSANSCAVISRIILEPLGNKAVTQPLGSSSPRTTTRTRCFPNALRLVSTTCNRVPAGSFVTNGEVSSDERRTLSGRLTTIYAGRAWRCIIGSPSVVVDVTHPTGA